ncbi:hypothetical protein K440DRAFT_76731 [Wilcoxina mikolae CBS 423.85]|nr:hypothetical protein K440DRAFT_76731 [Wilcoxina mikolae CBS 423.85]
MDDHRLIMLDTKSFRNPQKPTTPQKSPNTESPTGNQPPSSGPPTTHRSHCRSCRRDLLRMFITSSTTWEHWSFPERTTERD